MKQILFFLLLLTSAVSYSQEVVSDITTIEVLEDSLYYWKRVVITENGSPYPDTSINRDFIGSQEDALLIIERTAIQEQQRAAIVAAKSFDFRTSIGNFASLRTLYTSINGEELYASIGRRYRGIYEGEWIVWDQAGNSRWATLEIRPNGNYRLTTLSSRNGEPDGDQYTIRIRSKNNFTLVGFDGSNWEMVRDVRPGRERSFRPEDFAVRASGSLRMVKSKQ